jgi:putative ABC transport system permease protein
MSFKFVFRHLWQSRLYSLINIVGLATGITCMLLALLYSHDEHSYDRFHRNNPNLYRIVTMQNDKDGNSEIQAGTGQVQGAAFQNAVPEIVAYARVMGGEIKTDMSAEDKAIQITPLFVDPGFFRLFSFELLRGDTATALKETGGIVLTETTARKFFNSIDVVGKQIRMDADPSYDRLGKPLVVSAVIKDPPSNSSLQFDALFSFRFMQLSFEDDNWLNTYLGTFVLLRPGSNIKEVERKFGDVFAFHAKEQVEQNKKRYGFTLKSSYILEPMTDIHLNRMGVSGPYGESGIVNGSTAVYSYAFLAIAGFILLMASINFVNISIANSLKRAKEVGIRKISGGNRLQIIMQFLNESAILCVMAFALSLVMLSFSLPVFNELTGKRLTMEQIFQSSFVINIFTLFTGIILISGIYPAIMLSRFKPAKVLYNRQKFSGKNVFGKALVVIQFALAIFLLIATVIYQGQMDFVRTKDLGYNPQNIIRTAINDNRHYGSTIAQLKSEFVQEPSIKMTSFGSDGGREDALVNNKTFKVQYRSIDETLLDLLEIPLMAGRNLSRQFPADTRNGILVNESFARMSGLDQVIGASVKVDFHHDSTVKIIRGIVKDFHFGSLREPIKPMVMFMPEVPDGGIWVKFDKLKQQQAMAAMERIYKKVMPGSVYKFGFLDELNASDYLNEQRWKKLITIGSILALIICCLGLFGLAHLATNRRVKEIGIRKVLGASVREITLMLSGDFLKLVVFAFLLASPVAWMVMSKWLEGFAYRIEPGPWIFVLAGVLSVAVAFIAVSLHSIRSAIANPVRSLRSE